MTARTTRQLKQELIPVLRECAIAYDRLLCGNHTIMQCDSGLTVDILWGKENFMHLCGVHCNRPQSMFRNKGPHPSEVMFFYDQLIAGRLSPRHAHHCKRQAHTTKSQSATPVGPIGIIGFENREHPCDRAHLGSRR